MLLVSYDISDDKLRTKFSKFLSKFGYRMQYSVFQIENSERLLSVIQAEIRNKFESKFTESDSVIIYRIPDSCDTIRFGYAKNEETDLFIIV